MVKEMLNEVFKIKTETLPVSAAKETDRSGFLANKKLYYYVDRKIKIYELIYVEEYLLEIYQLIDVANGIARCKMSGLREENEICCNCNKDIRHEEKIWIRKETGRQYTGSAIIITEGGYVVCLDCAKEYRNKVNLFFDYLKNECEICHQKHTVIRSFKIESGTIKACDNCIKEYAKTNNLNYNLSY